MIPLAAEIAFRWSVALGIAASAAIALFLPLALAWWTRRRTGASWKYFAFGALVFFVSQGVLRLPWQVALGRALASRIEADPRVFWAWAAVSSFTAALFEEVGRYVGYRTLVRGERSWRVGVMYGLGHGGIESILLIGLSLAGMLVLYVRLGHGAALPIPPEAMPKIREQFAGATAANSLLGGIERIWALALHVACSLLVLQVLLRRQWRWLGYALGLHTAMNFAAVGAMRLWGGFAAEGVTGLFAVLALAIILRLRRAPEGAALGPTAAA